MTNHILRCSKCKKYTLEEECCSTKTEKIIPPKFSIEDNYGKYRRTVKQESLKKEGLL